MNTTSSFVNCLKSIVPDWVPSLLQFTTTFFPELFYQFSNKDIRIASFMYFILQKKMLDKKPWHSTMAALGNICPKRFACLFVWAEEILCSDRCNLIKARVQLCQSRLTASVPRPQLSGLPRGDVYVVRRHKMCKISLEQSFPIFYPFLYHVVWN